MHTIYCCEYCIFILFFFFTLLLFMFFFFFFQAEDGIRDKLVTGVQTCALPILTYLTIKDVRDAYSKTRNDVINFLHEVAIEVFKIEKREVHINEENPIVTYIRSEEHTSELQSLAYLVCRLLLEKKNYSIIQCYK